MKHLVDVVNFNADASCLTCQRWLDILAGGKKSEFAKWLNLYVDRNKKVVLGFPGATVADLATHNPEAIDLINRHPQVFEVILRPFAHDISLLRVGEGFIANVEYGRMIITREFINIRNYFLPPEFMLTNEQIGQLAKLGFDGVFINSARFSAEVGQRVPVHPYRINGVLGSSLNCIPFKGELTNNYLHALQKFDCSLWNESLAGAGEDILFSWRDGESSFFLPNGLEREAFWIDNEDGMISREHLWQVGLDYIPNEKLVENLYHSYPVHSFMAWMKEFRMLGFIHKVQRIEDSLARLSQAQIQCWLMIINSDILSAVEKQSPLVRILSSPDSEGPFEFTIKRSERGFEGEEFLAIFDSITIDGDLPSFVKNSHLAHLVKWRGRIEYLKNQGL